MYHLNQTVIVYPLLATMELGGYDKATGLPCGDMSSILLIDEMRQWAGLPTKVTRVWNQDGVIGYWLTRDGISWSFIHQWFQPQFIIKEL